MANNNAGLAVSGDASDDEPFRPKGKGGFSAFAAVGIDDGGVAEEEEEDFGGLMVCTRVLDVLRSIISCHSVCYQGIGK